jgi:hypothetical protein
MRMKKSDTEPAPGGFYHRALDLIRVAHPTRDAGWQRARAREIMTSVFEERVRLLKDAPRAVSSPTYPQTAEDLAHLEEDFKAGAKAGQAKWTAVRGSKQPDSIEVAQANGVICIRRGRKETDPAMYFSMPDWQVFVRYLEEVSRSNQLVSLQPDAPKVLDEGLTKTKKEDLVSAVEGMLAAV